MSRATRERICREEAADQKTPTFETRFDLAHPVDAGSESPLPFSASEAFSPQSAAPCISEESEEQLSRQAAQLAEYLRMRQAELDHREAQLNAQLAQLECESRAARLWLNEREAELRRRQGDLADGEREVARRLDRLADAENSLKQRATFNGGDATIAAQKSGQSSDESLLQERRRIAAFKQQAIAEVEAKRQSLHKRSEHLDRCRAALRILHGRLQEEHRETLEIRLAVEELWIQLAGSAPPAELTLSLERIRGQLADQYRMAGAELLERKEEIESLRGELASQCEAFAAQKKQYEQWVAARQRELDLQAQRLVERERLLKEQHSTSFLQTPTAN